MAVDDDNFDNTAVIILVGTVCVFALVDDLLHDCYTEPKKNRWLLMCDIHKPNHDFDTLAEHGSSHSTVPYLMKI